MSEQLNDHKKRAHALLSASSAHRWLACPPSAVAADGYKNEETDYTAEGTLAHEVAEWVASGRSKLENLPKGQDDGVTAEMIECAKEYADYIREQYTEPNPLVLLEQRVDFSPWVPEGFGTADCIIIQGGVMDVVDYKYGKGVQVSAEKNPQELLYGLGALNDYGFAFDVDTVRLHIFQPRMNNISRYDLSAAELQAWGEQIKPIAAQAYDGKGKYAAGSWCKFCPHAGRCRTLTKTCTEYVDLRGKKTGVEVLAPFEVAAILEQEPLISLWLKKVREQALTDLLDGREIPGYKVVAGRGSRDWADEIKTSEALQAAGYTREDITKTELLSVAGMEKALGKKKVAELVGDLIETTQGSPTVAPESDRRPVYDRVAEAKKDFDD